MCIRASYNHALTCIKADQRLRRYTTVDEVLMAWLAYCDMHHASCVIGASIGLQAVLDVGMLIRSQRMARICWGGRSCACQQL